MTAIGLVGLSALRKLAAVNGGVAGCDDRMLEKLLLRVLNELDEFSLKLTAGKSAAWMPGSPGWMPDLLAEDSNGWFVAGIEVKTRANINWGRYGTATEQSQLDRYAARATEIGADAAPLYLVVDSTKKELILRKLSDSRIVSSDRWSVLTLDELLDLAPRSKRAASAQASAQEPAVQLLASLLAKP